MISTSDIARAAEKLTDTQRADVLAIVEQLAAYPLYGALPEHVLRDIDEGLAEYHAGRTIAANEIMADIRRRAAAASGAVAAE